jgi:hypothetical protein
MPVTSESMIGSATTPATVCKGKPRVLATTLPKQDAEGDGHGR